MSDFASLMRRASAFYRIETDDTRRVWWTGYKRGLRRAHHGVGYCTEAEHALYLSAADSTDPTRAALGRGYAAGLKMIAADPD